jgi:methionyl-tRNA formyltransferase
LRALLKRADRPLALVTAAARRSGRGRKIVENPLVVLAQTHGLAVLQPESARAADFLQQLRAYDADLGIVVSYGQILSDELLGIPKFGCINVHGSLLPRWRGASPVQAAILAGDTSTGVCVQKVVKKLDAGRVLCSRSLAIAADERGDELFERLSRLSAETLVDFLDQIGEGPLPEGLEQDPESVTICRRIRRLDGEIHWQQPAIQIDALVRAMAGWPWAQAKLPDGQAVRLLRGVALPQCKLETGPDDTATIGTGTGTAPAGQLLSTEGGLTIACADGAYRVDRLQRPGKAPLDAAEFLRGYNLEIGSIWS